MKTDNIARLTIARVWYKFEADGTVLNVHKSNFFKTMVMNKSRNQRETSRSDQDVSGELELSSSNGNPILKRLHLKSHILRLVHGLDEDDQDCCNIFNSVHSFSHILYI